jgi:hypothetical protein
MSEFKFDRKVHFIPTKSIKNEYVLEAVKYALEKAGGIIHNGFAKYESLRHFNGLIISIDESICFSLIPNDDPTCIPVELDQLFNHVDFVWPEWATGFGYFPYTDAPIPVSHRQSLVFYNENVYVYADGKYKEDVGPFAFSKFSNARRDTLQHIATRIIVDVQQPLPEVGKVYSVSYNSDTSEYFDAKILSNIDGSIVGRWLDGPRIGQLFDYTANGLEHKFKPVVSQEEKDFIKRASEILFNSDKKNSFAGLSKDLYDNGCRFVKKEEE